VLFADLVGFTGLAEYMDPEQVKRLIHQCFERLIEVVVEFGGRVDKILGDGMLVLFGAPVAHEDDPERAVRAALRMQHVLAEFVATSELAGSDNIRMRVGINSGEVLVGTMAGSDYTAMGDVVNTASRLQASSPPGGVLVGESTYALTSHTFAYDPFGELQPRGREQSLTAWLALEAIAPPGRRRRRDVGIVGRHSELAVADAAIELVRVVSSTKWFSTFAIKATRRFLKVPAYRTERPTSGGRLPARCPTTSTSTLACHWKRCAVRRSLARRRCFRTSHSKTPSEWSMSSFT